MPINKIIQPVVKDIITDIFPGGGDAPPIYAPNAVQFDGANDYTERATTLDGVVNGQFGICAFNFQIKGSMGVERNIFNSSFDRVSVSMTSGDKVRVQLRSSSGTVLLALASNTSIINDSMMHHALFTWDTRTPQINSLHLDDVLDANILQSNDGIVQYISEDSRMGFDVQGILAKFNGCISDFYLNYDVDMDFSIVANRRKFVDVNGKGIFLGSNGELPTGTSPIIFFDETANNFNINKGTGGNFVTVGTLENCT